MQQHYSEFFERDMGIRESEWLWALRRAVGQHALQVQGSTARVQVGTGGLDLVWQVLAPRRIALLQMPRLGVQFRFFGLSDEERLAFMRPFDLSMQRGGG